MIKTILFDIGDVITFASFEKIASDICTVLKIDSDEFLKYQKDNIRSQLIGEKRLIDTYNDFPQFSQRFDLDGFKNAWISCIKENTTVNTELLRWIDSLRNQYQLGILTNNNEYRNLYDLHIDLHSHFDFVIESFKEGLKKPDPDFFKLAIAASKCLPEEIIFIDDKERNVVVAGELGINTVMYSDNSKLRAQLAEFGVQIIDQE